MQKWRNEDLSAMTTLLGKTSKENKESPVNRQTAGLSM